MRDSSAGKFARVRTRAHAWEMEGELYTARASVHSPALRIAVRGRANRRARDLTGPNWTALHRTAGSEIAATPSFRAQNREETIRECVGGIIRSTGAKIRWVKIVGFMREIAISPKFPISRG